MSREDKGHLVMIAMCIPRVSEHLTGLADLQMAIHAFKQRLRPWEDGPVLILKMDGRIMIIVWRGWGFLSVIIIGAVTVATLLGTLWVTETLQLPDWTKALDIAISPVMAGVVNWIAGRYLNKASKSRFVPDDKTGRSSGDSAVRHDLFFIKMEYWSVPLFVIAARLTAAAFFAR